MAPYMNRLIAENLSFEEGVPFVACLGGGILSHEKGEVNSRNMPPNLFPPHTIGAHGPFSNGEQEAIAC
jgi:hypothetical protein